MEGIVLVDKPVDWTSFDVVAKIRGIARATTGNKKIKVGHAGTLDPLATGLLIVLIGSATKQQDQFMKQDKTYEAQITLGSTSDTFDSEGLKRAVSVKKPSISQILATLDKFTGQIEQIPPQHSAIKIDGKRAYVLARAGKSPEMKPRSITIHSIELKDYKYPFLQLTCSVSSGTYIRSLANDIGSHLATGGYLSALRRTRIGKWDIVDADKINELDTSNLAASVKPMNND